MSVNRLARHISATGVSRQVVRQRRNGLGDIPAGGLFKIEQDRQIVPFAEFISWLQVLNQRRPVHSHQPVARRSALPGAVFIDESGVSQRPHRCRTWAPRGQTPVLQYNFNWKTLSAIAGLTFWSFYFRLSPGTVKSAQVVDRRATPSPNCGMRFRVTRAGVSAEEVRLLTGLVAGIVIADPDLRQQVIDCLREMLVRLPIDETQFGNLDRLMERVDLVRPDVLIVEIGGLGDRTEETLRALKSRASNPAIIVVDSVAQPALIIAAMRGGSGRCT